MLYSVSNLYLVLWDRRKRREDKNEEENENKEEQDNEGGEENEVGGENIDEDENDENFDQDEKEECHLLDLLVGAMGKDQVRGQFQDGSGGMFQKKELEQLSLRGIIHHVYETKRTIVCKYDGNKPKPRSWAMIKHIQRRVHDLTTEVPFTIKRKWMFGNM